MFLPPFNMSDYDSSVQTMREQWQARKQARYQEDMATLINAIAKANKLDLSSFYVDTMLCDDVLKVAEKDFDIAYYTSEKDAWGRSESRLTTNIQVANSMRLTLKKDQSDAKTEKSI